MLLIIVTSDIFTFCVCRLHTPTRSPCRTCRILAYCRPGQLPVLQFPHRHTAELKSSPRRSHYLPVALWSGRPSNIKAAVNVITRLHSPPTAAAAVPRRREGSKVRMVGRHGLHVIGSSTVRPHTPLQPTIFLGSSSLHPTIDRRGESSPPNRTSAAVAAVAHAGVVMLNVLRAHPNLPSRTFRHFIKTDVRCLSP